MDERIHHGLGDCKMKILDHLIFLSFVRHICFFGLLKSDPIFGFSL